MELTGLRMIRPWLGSRAVSALTCASLPPGHWSWCFNAEAGHSGKEPTLRQTGARHPQTAVLRAVSTLSKIRYRQRFVMESQTGMSPKLSPEPLKMSLPSINCHDSKTNGRSLNVCASPPPSWFFPQLPVSLFSLHPRRPPPPRLQGHSGHSDLIRLCPGEAAPLHTDRWGWRRFDKCQGLKRLLPDWSELE